MWEVVRQFEKAMCEYTGAPRAVAVESCTAALFLCCLWNRVRDCNEVVLPSFTYPSVPAAVVHAGGRVRFVDGLEWQEEGWYKLTGHDNGVIFGNTDYYVMRTCAVDSAKYIARGMWADLGLDHVCLSFHHKKALPIGRGGMILCEDVEDEEWFRWMRHDGRTEGVELSADVLHGVGWNFNFTPEQAARGLCLLSRLPDRVILPPEPYQDLSKYSFFTGANR